MTTVYKLTTATILQHKNEKVCEKKIDTKNTLHEIISSSCRHASIYHDDVYMFDGKIIQAVGDEDMYSDMFNRVPDPEQDYEYEHTKFRELPNDFDSRDLYEWNTYHDLNDWEIYSTPVDKIKERFDSGATLVVVWAIYQDDGCYPEVSYIEKILVPYEDFLQKPTKNDLFVHV